MKRILLVLLIAVLSLSAITAAGSQETETQVKEIYFWHAFSDAARFQWIQDRADEFNAMQSDYKVVLETKGGCRDTLQAAVLADKQGTPPHLVQLFEVGSQLAYDTGMFKSVGDVKAALDEAKVLSDAKLKEYNANF